MQDIHPLAAQMNMWCEQKNLFMKTGMLLSITRLMRWESILVHEKMLSHSIYYATDCQKNVPTGWREKAESCQCKNKPSAKTSD
jgi:hypothetical protein